MYYFVCGYLMKCGKVVDKHNMGLFKKSFRKILLYGVVDRDIIEL